MNPFDVKSEMNMDNNILKDILIEMCDNETEWKKNILSKHKHKLASGFEKFNRYKDQNDAAEAILCDYLRVLRDKNYIEISELSDQCIFKRVTSCGHIYREELNKSIFNKIISIVLNHPIVIIVAATLILYYIFGIE